METILKSSKINLTFYWIATVLISILYFGSSTFYIFKYDMVAENMVHLGYPTYLIYYLVVAKLTGISIVLFSKISSLTEWAYAGLFINCLLAAIAHGHVGDGWVNAGSIGAILVLTSYFYGKKVGKV